MPLQQRLQNACRDEAVGAAGKCGPCCSVAATGRMTMIGSPRPAISAEVISFHCLNMR
jgi:hypothetical protein